MKSSFYLAFAIIILSSCQKENITDYAALANCISTSPTYIREIKSILNSNCSQAGCHNAQSQSAGIDLSDFSSSKNNFLNDVKCLASVHYDKMVNAMPKGRPALSSQEIQQLDCWVKNGCPE